MTHQEIFIEVLTTLQMILESGEITDEETFEAVLDDLKMLREALAEVSA